MTGLEAFAFAGEAANRSYLWNQLFCHIVAPIVESPSPEMLKNTDEITARPRITSAAVHPFFVAEVESSFTAELSQRGG